MRQPLRTIQVFEKRVAEGERDGGWPESRHVQIHRDVGGRCRTIVDVDETRQAVAAAAQMHPYRALPLQRRHAAGVRDACRDVNEHSGRASERRFQLQVGERAPGFDSPAGMCWSMVWLSGMTTAAFPSPCRKFQATAKGECS